MLGLVGLGLWGVLAVIPPIEGRPDVFGPRRTACST
jgi:hypothetical protein